MSLVATCTLNAQNAASAVCNFDDGRQITVRYQPSPGADRKLQNGEVWSPGKAPTLFFTSAVLKVGNSEIPVGAYSMYVIPAKDHWTLVLNKGVSENSRYDQKQDLLRTAMDIGTLPEPVKNVAISFGHVAPKECNMRVYYGKTGAWTEFREQ
jgi:hypothetical protein